MSQEIKNKEEAMILDYLSKNSQSSKLSLQMASRTLPTPLNYFLQNLKQTGYISSSGYGIDQTFKLENPGRHALEVTRRKIFEKYINDRHSPYSLGI